MPFLAITKTATTASTAATVANTAATNASTVATKALALAQKMTPWGLVAGLIGGVMVGIGSYIASTKKLKKKRYKILLLQKIS